MNILLRHIRNMGTWGVLWGCLFLTMVGCSSRLQTTVMSGTEPSKPTAVEKVEPIAVPVVKADVPAPHIEESRGIPRIDIPVEEPARPVIRPSVPQEIFATSRTEIVEPQISAVPVSPVIAEPMPESSIPLEGTPEASQPMGIPSSVIEPEMPALPTIREHIAPPQELVMKSEPEQVEQIAPPQDLVEKIAPEPVKESQPAPVPEMPKVAEPEPAPKPMEVAKVVPPTPEIMETVLKPLRDVYFDYDRFAIRPDAASVLKDNSKSLVGGLSDKNIVIEGHCDERGSSSYNMVLGERRAQAVKKYLIDLGVPADKVQTVSFGKERPFCMDQTEECWQENRRGHFVLK